MATLPNAQLGWTPMTAEELFAVRGTPEFERELHRQMEAVAEHDRRSRREEPWEPDWAWLDTVWK